MNLLPYPRQLERTPGFFQLPTRSLILLDLPNPQQGRLAASRLQQALSAAGLYWDLTASTALPAAQIGISLRLDPHAVAEKQGYTLRITAHGAALIAHDLPGLFYAALTLVQIIKDEAPALPCLDIHDWPDFPMRGVMLDISRDKVPSMPTLYHLIDLLADWKVNQFQLYTEHTFAFRAHPEVWANASPVTGEEILALDAYCKERHIELVPNQNSFGHMHRWCNLPRYAPLGEMYGHKQQFWWGSGSFSLCATDPACLPFLRGLYDELLSHFSSQKFNVGCDETFDLGKGRSAAACAEKGQGRVYLDFLLQIYREVSQRGKQMLFWGDIIMEYPELVSELPRDLVALEWGYEADHAFAEHSARFAASQIPYYVCPGTSSWNTIAGRTDNALGNLRLAAESGLKNGAIGYLNTDWGDNGHWQPLPVSFLGFAAGAAYSWCLVSAEQIDLPGALDRDAFKEGAGVMGKAAYELGNIYQQPGLRLHNSSPLFHLLQRSEDELQSAKYQVSPDALHATLASIDQAAAPLAKARPCGPDAEVLVREYTLVVELLRHATQRGLYIFEPHSEDRARLKGELLALIEEFRLVWLLRNRPGGLNDSVRRFDNILQNYS